MIACRELSSIHRRLVLRNYLRKVEAFPSTFQSCSCHRHSSSSIATAARDIASNNSTTNHHKSRSTPYATNNPLYQLNPHEVHIWWADPADFTPSLHLLQDLLPPEELQECQPTSSTNTINNNNNYTERLVSRALLRTLLARYLVAQTPGSSSSSSSIPPAKQLVITRNTHGKPDLQWPPCNSNNINNTRLRFNVAHTCGLIGIAITSDTLVGLDIETTGRRTRHTPATVARRRFSALEYGNLNALLTDEEKAAYFIRLWTLKEAYVKAVGRGISAAPGLKGFSFSVEEEERDGGGKIQFSSACPDRIQWDFALLGPSDRHIAALCVQKMRNGGIPVSIKSFRMGGGGGEGEETVVTTTVPLLARGHSD